MNLTLESPVSEFNGIGEARSRALSRLGIKKAGDILLRYPRAYQNRGDVQSLGAVLDFVKRNEKIRAFSLILTVATVPVARMIRRGMNIMKFRAFDESGSVEIVYFNQNYLKETFSVGSTFRFWGRAALEKGVFRMTNPIYEPWTEEAVLPDFVPVYTLTQGISQKLFSSLVKEALAIAEKELEETLPADVLKDNSLAGLTEAYKYIHLPNGMDEVEKAKRRFCFEQVYCMSLSFLYEKHKQSDGKCKSFKKLDLTEFKEALPFELTKAQNRALDEISGDLSSQKPMKRILIGDVGSGKTAVAEGAAYLAVKNGFQCAIMAPTEILAHQHYDEMKPFFRLFGINTELLCSSTPAAEKRRILESLSGVSDNLTGMTDVVIGTHALLTENVEFKKLGLVITDEQHRFGVMQRAALASKSKSVHTLVMSATPIPRTLSLVYFGDLSKSVLDELPPGRQRVETYVVDERYRDRLDRFIRTHVKAGNRVFIVCPMVDESQCKATDALRKKAENDPEEMADIGLFDFDELKPLKSTVEYARELSLRLPDLRIGLVHGKLKSAQKDEIMNRFVNGELDVLVATTVIEVGVNVPEATLMIVENAERFGLSQLHQLRGRVGRSDRKSFCILVSDSDSEKAKSRLNIMKTTYDGFEIAKADLKLRGAGDFFSTDGVIRQHGEARYFSFNEGEDSEIIEKAVNAASKTSMDDPLLKNEENRAIRDKVRLLASSNSNIIS